MTLLALGCTSISLSLLHSTLNTWSQDKSVDITRDRTICSMPASICVLQRIMLQNAASGCARTWNCNQVMLPCIELARSHLLMADPTGLCEACIQDSDCLTLNPFPTEHVGPAGLEGLSAPQDHFLHGFSTLLRPLWHTPENSKVEGG